MRKGAIPFCILLFNVFSVPAWAQSWQLYSDSAKFYLGNNESLKALHFFNTARDIIKKDSSNSVTFIQLSRSIGLIHYNQSQFKKAAVYFDEAKTTSETLFGKDARYAAILNILAATYNSAGDYRLAEQHYIEARKIRLDLLGDQHSDYAQSCNNLGFFYWSIGNYEKSEPLILEGKRIREQLQPVKQHPSYAISCTNLANLYRDMGQYGKSEALYKEAKEVRALVEPVRRSRDYANSCNILADLYNLKGDYDRAEPLYLEAKDIRSANKYSYPYGESCTNLFALYREQGDYKKAEPLALEAKQIFDSILPPTDPSSVILLNNMGELYYRMGSHKKAETYFLEARLMWETTLGKEHPYYTSNSSSLARLYWVMGEVSKADNLYQSAFQTKFQQIEKVFQFTSEAEKTAFVQNITGNADEYFSFYYNKLKQSDATQPLLISLKNRNLILSSTQKLRSFVFNSKDTILYDQFEEWSITKQSIARLYADPKKLDVEKLKALEDSANFLEKELTRRSSKFQLALQNGIDLKLLQQSIREGEAAIEFINFRYHSGIAWTDSILYAAIVLRSQQPPKMIMLFEKKELDGMMNVKDAEGSAVSFYNYRTANQVNSGSWRGLYDLIWKPLESVLIGINKIYFSPSGKLHQLSIASIPVSEIQHLTDKFRLEQLGNIYSITTSVKNKIVRTSPLIFYGGINYDSSKVLQDTVALKSPSPVPLLATSNMLRGGKTWSYLPGTRTEVEVISGLARSKNYSIKVIEGLQATEESLKTLQGKSSPFVLHIASHGFFYPDPQEDKRNAFQKSFDKSGAAFKNAEDPLLRSGLLFAGANHAWQGRSFENLDDGILTAFEVSNLYLPNTKLVVLSACETALGDVQGSEGVYGLQRSFKMAGVQHLIMSLWKVPDAETAEFMQILYKQYLEGEGIHDAFRTAQISMKNKYKGEPSKWAAWILIR